MSDFKARPNLEEFDKIMEKLYTSAMTDSFTIPRYSVQELIDCLPNCCKGCSNHLTNGGSGVCWCTAPMNDPSNPMRVMC